MKTLTATTTSQQDAVLFQFSRNPQFLTAGFNSVKSNIVSFILRQLFVNCTAKLQKFPHLTKSKTNLPTQMLSISPLIFLNPCYELDMLFGDVRDFYYFCKKLSGYG